MRLLIANGHHLCLYATVHFCTVVFFAPSDSKSPDFGSPKIRRRWSPSGKYYELTLKSLLGSSLTAHPPAKGTVYSAFNSAVSQHWFADLCPADHASVH